jgi:hypothetical protein
MWYIYIYTNYIYIYTNYIYIYPISISILYLYLSYIYKLYTIKLYVIYINIYYGWFTFFLPKIHIWNCIRHQNRTVPVARVNIPLDEGTKLELSQNKTAFVTQIYAKIYCSLIQRAQHICFYIHFKYMHVCIYIYICMFE